MSSEATRPSEVSVVFVIQIEIADLITPCTLNHTSLSALLTLRYCTSQCLPLPYHPAEQPAHFHLLLSHLVSPEATDPRWLTFPAQWPRASVQTRGRPDQSAWHRLSLSGSCCWQSLPDIFKIEAFSLNGRGRVRRTERGMS